MARAKIKQYNFNPAPLPVRAVITLVFTIYSLVCILPILLMIAVSFTSQTEIIRNGYNFIPGEFSFSAYRILFEDPMAIGRAYMITIGIVVVGIVANAMICSMYAYATSRPEFAYRRVFIVMLIITMVFSGGLPAFYYMYSVILGLRNNLLAMLLPGLGSGFFIIVMHTYFRQSVPKEIIESARIDGSREVNTYFKIVLPISTPILATIAVFTALFYWNDFFNCMIFIDQTPLYNLQYTMQRALMNVEALKRQITISPAASLIFTSQGDLPGESLRMAMVVLGIGPIVAVYPFFQRYFVSGLTLGSVKE